MKVVQRCATRCCPTLRRVALLEFANPAQWGDRAVGRTTEAFEEYLHMRQRRASHRGHRRDPVRRHRRRHRDHPAACAGTRLIPRWGSLCCAPSLSTGEENVEVDMDASTSLLSGLISSGASIVVPTSPPVTGKPSTPEEGG